MSFVLPGISLALRRVQQPQLRSIPPQSIAVDSCTWS